MLLMIFSKLLKKRDVAKLPIFLFPNTVNNIVCKVSNSGCSIYIFDSTLISVDKIKNNKERAFHIFFETLSCMLKYSFKQGCGPFRLPAHLEE